jgi:hypothetical protein
VKRRRPAVELLESRTLPSFLSPTVYTVFPTSRDFAAGDFNGDGIPDFAIVGTNGTADSLMVLLSKPDGTFQFGGSYAAGSNDNAVAVGDFNGDGTADLAVARSNGTVEILLGNGDGSFRIQGDYPVGVNSINRLAAGDFNGDGVSDLAVVSQNQKSVTVLLGNGDGSFGPGVSYAVAMLRSSRPPTSPRGAPNNSVAVADFTGSGYPDLVSPWYDGVFVLVNDGHWPTTRAGEPGGATRPAPVEPWMPLPAVSHEPSPARGAEVEPLSSRLPVSWAPGHPEEWDEAVSFPTEASMSPGGRRAAIPVRTLRPPQPVTGLTVLRLPFTTEKQGETEFAIGGHC